MKRLFVSMLLGIAFLSAQAAYSDTAKLYHPNANAKQEIAEAVKSAKQQGKNVLIQAGGNWCSWCIEFNRFTTQDAQLDSAIKANYVVYHLNYSPENKNVDIFKQYSFPQRFGFPVFLILDGNGNLIHTQNSSYLEEGKSYNKKKILGFLADWRPSALDEKNYK